MDRRLGKFKAAGTAARCGERRTGSATTSVPASASVL